MRRSVYADAARHQCPAAIAKPQRPPATAALDRPPATAKLQRPAAITGLQCPAVTTKLQRPTAIARLQRLVGLSVLLFTAVIGASVLGTGCRFVSTPIGRIVREPYKYQGMEVTVAGRVEAPRWMPGVGAAGFRVVDGGDSLLVLTLHDPPPAGTRVRLQGRFLRRFPVDGTERMVILYRTDPGDERLPGTIDPR